LGNLHQGNQGKCSWPLATGFRCVSSSFLKISLIACFSVLLPCGTASAKPDLSQISSQALDQIQALLSEKAQRTPAQKKISSHLLHAKKMRLGQAVAKGVQSLMSGVKVHAGETTDIYIRADVSQSVIGQIKAMGGTNIKSFPKHRGIHVRIPLSQLETLALLPQVQFIRPADHAITNSHSLPDVTEGDQAHPFHRTPHRSNP